MKMSIHDALAQVKDAFARREKPREISYCQACYTAENVASFLSLPVSQMTAFDLSPLLRDAYVCWGTWPEIAYYVPCLLKLYAADAIPDEEELYTKLLLAVRPELGNSLRRSDIGERMTLKERQSIFHFVMAVFEARLTEEEDEPQVWRMTETLSFLAAFDQPLEPLLLRLESSHSQKARANLCMFLAENLWLALPFQNLRLKNFTLLPDNAEALSRLFAPSHVAEYLLVHAADVAVFGKDQQAKVVLAFDWAMAQQAPT